MYQDHFEQSKVSLFFPKVLMTLSAIYAGEDFSLYTLSSYMLIFMIADMCNLIAILLLYRPVGM